MDAKTEVGYIPVAPGNLPWPIKFENLTDEIQALINNAEASEAKWERLRTTLTIERDTFEKKPGQASGIWETGYRQGLSNALMFLQELKKEGISLKGGE